MGSARLLSEVQIDNGDPVDGDERSLRIFFDLVRDFRPGYSLSDVWRSEGDGRVAVTVIRRELVGVGPGGEYHGGKLVSCYSCVQIKLRYPLGNCPVIDGSTGQPVRQLDRAAVRDPEYGDLDYGLSYLVRNEGCPVWR